MAPKALSSDGAKLQTIEMRNVIQDGTSDTEMVTEEVFETVKTYQ